MWSRGGHHRPEQSGRCGGGLVPWGRGGTPAALACGLHTSDLCNRCFSSLCSTCPTVAAVVSGVAMAYHSGAYAVQAAGEAPSADTAMERVAITRVEQWRAQWGFLDDTDFAHAFASYDSAIAHGGHHVVDAWLQGRSRNMEDELIPRAAAVAESSGSTDRPPRWAEALPICRGVRIYGRALFRMGHAKLYVPRSPSPSPTGHREHWLDLDHREHWLDLDPRALAICLGIRPVDTAKQPESAFGHVWRMCYSKPAGHVYVGMGNHAHRLPTTKWTSPWQIGVNCTRHSHTTSSTCGRRYGMSWRSWRAWSWCVIAPCPKHVRLTYWRGLSLTDRA